MKYLIALVLNLSLVINIAANQSWKCNPDDTHKCPSENQTCCPSIHSPSKYVCFNSPNGQCCPDYQNFCPNGTECNMIDLKCNPEAPYLSFLGLPLEIEPFTNPTGPINNGLKHKPVPAAGDILNFSLGFFEGFEVFSNLPEEHHCLDDLVSQTIPNDILEIFNIIKDLNTKSDFIDVIKNVSWYLIDIYNIVTDAAAPCKDWSVELKEAGTKVLNVFKTDKYAEKIALHIVLNLGDYRDKAMKGYEAIVTGDYYAGGVAFGDLIRFNYGI